jgi:hypothetical protein
MPRHFIWANGSWQKRKQGRPVDGFPGYVRDDALGRVYTIHPSNREAFHLRILLHQTRGPTSFQDLKLIKVRDAAGNVIATKQCSTFMEACHELGLIDDDSHWNEALQEAALSRSPAQLRDLFAIMLASCGLSNPAVLWNAHRDSMTEDILHRARVQNPELAIHHSEALYNQTLILLEDKVQLLTGKSLSEYGLPEPNRGFAEIINKDILWETSYNVAHLEEYVKRNEPLLTADQRAAYEAICTMLTGEQGGIVFLDAPGGTGKTFLLNLLLAFVRRQQFIALAVASSGIAATLLAGGRTAHSTFKLPLNLDNSDTATCHISMGTGLAYVLQHCKLIVWDEATMSHRNAFHALDKTLQDLRSNKMLMGGFTIVLSGDFHQTLPVIARGTPEDEINACLKSSALWHHVTKFSLKTNMRAHLQGDASAGHFAQTLLQIGNGQVQASPATGNIQLPCGTLVSSIIELRDRVYPNLSDNFQNQGGCVRGPSWPQGMTVSMPSTATL